MKEKNLVDFLIQSADKYENHEAFVGLKKYRKKIWTYGESLEYVSMVDQFLHDNNIQKGDKIIICAPNSPYWVFIFFACATRGIIAVPLDVNSSDDFIEKIYHKIKPKLFFVSTYKKLDTTIQNKIIIENLEHLLKDYKPNVESLSSRNDNENDLLEIVFTSGSTGDPKGVLITHKNLISNINLLNDYVRLPMFSRFLSIIPLSHMFEQAAGLLSAIKTGSAINYPNSIKPKDLLKALMDQRISIIISVPVFLSLLERKIEQAAKKQNSLEKLEKLLGLAKNWPRWIQRILFIKVHKQLGGHLRLFFVGGAPLGEKSEDFWNSLGISVIQGYGATEAAPVIATNSLTISRTNSVGKVIPGQEIKITGQGEVLTKGDNICQGYFEDEEATKKIFEDGWLKTGDVGEIDDEGFLFLRSRIKNMIVTSSGMKVFPEDIEKHLNQSPAVTESIILGIKKNESIQITAVLLLNEEIDYDDLVKQVNEKLASHQKIQNIIIWPESDFPRTPTRKVRRIPIQEKVEKILSGAEKDNSKSDTGGSLLYKIISDVSEMSIEEISAGKNLLSDLKIDSIKRIQLISRMEEEYSLSLSEALITQDTIVGDLEKIVLTKKSVPLPKSKNWWQLNRCVVCIRMITLLCVLGVTRLFQKLNVVKADILPKTPVIYVANHTSHLDTSTVLRALPYQFRKKLAVAAAKDYFYKNKLLSFFTTILFNTFPVDRGGDLETTLMQIGDLLNRGWSILIYPEGGRGSTGKMVELKDGIGLIAQQMEVPIVPIKIDGNFEIFPKGRKYPKKGKTTVKFGQSKVYKYDQPFSEITGEIEKDMKNF